MWRCCTSKKPCLACGMERRLWTARTLASPHWPPPRRRIHRCLQLCIILQNCADFSTITARERCSDCGDPVQRPDIPRTRSARIRRAAVAAGFSRLACNVCIKNTVHTFLECSAIGCSSCSMQSGAVGASMRSSAVTVAKGGMYQSKHGIYHALYHATKVVYTSIYTM